MVAAPCVTHLCLFLSMVLIKFQMQFDYVAVHWYGTDQQALIRYLQQWRNTFNKPIMLTEFACMVCLFDRNALLQTNLTLGCRTLSTTARRACPRSTCSIRMPSVTSTRRTGLHQQCLSVSSDALLFQNCADTFLRRFHARHVQRQP